MQLSELIKDIDIIEMTGSGDINVDGISYHTRDVVENGCFVAIDGTAVDGHDYVDTAIDNGARVVVSSKRVSVPRTVTNILVQNPRRVLALMSSRLFAEPSKEMKLVGVTGTNGKTTITYLLESVLKSCGFNPGVIGTVNYRYGSVRTNPKHTTPESYELQRLFKDMLSASVDSVVMEVSSHSLDQNRVYGCQFDGAVFTNLTQDHLDYHLDMSRYQQAKAKLFTEHLAESKKKDTWAVINIDDSFGAKLASELTTKVYAFSLSKEVDVYAEDAKYSFDGVTLALRLSGQSLNIKSALVGRHNASNVVGAVAAAFALGLPLDKIKEGIEAVRCVPGRLEPVQNSKSLNVLVDYAHTPDAIRNVTTALKELKPARLITVFGCGGDRDKTKRPLMGFEAALKSDLLIVTSDNPRSENSQKIVDEIISGVKKIGLEEGKEDGGYFVEVDRRKAIRKAISLAKPEDIVLIAGKGHEDYQIIGSEKYDFDDVKVATEAMEKI